MALLCRKLHQKESGIPCLYNKIEWKPSLCYTLFTENKNRCKAAKNGLQRLFWHPRLDSNQWPAA